MRKSGVSEQKMTELIRAGRLGYGSSVWAHGFTAQTRQENTPLRQYLPPATAGWQSSEQRPGMSARLRTHHR